MLATENNHPPRYYEQQIFAVTHYEIDTSTISQSSKLKLTLGGIHSFRNYISHSRAYRAASRSDQRQGGWRRRPYCFCVCLCECVYAILRGPANFIWIFNIYWLISFVRNNVLIHTKWTFIIYLRCKYVFHSLYDSKKCWCVYYTWDTRRSIRGIAEFL